MCKEDDLMCEIDNIVTLWQGGEANYICINKIKEQINLYEQNDNNI